jgi:uncharacterized membrane protein
VMDFQMSELSFLLWALVLQVCAWSFPYYLTTIWTVLYSFIKSDVHCTTHFIHFFQVLWPQQPCHQLLRFWIAHSTSTVAVLNKQ